MARLAPDAVLGRVFGLFESLITLAAGLGALAASLLIEWTSVSVALVIVGTLCPSLVLVAWRRLRHLDRYIGEIDKEIGLLHGVPMFQPLPCRLSNSWLAVWNRSRCRRPGRISPG